MQLWICLTLILACYSNAEIPKIVHYIYGLKGGEVELSLEHYLSIKATIQNVNPDIIYFHYAHEPTGVFWNIIKPQLILNMVEVPKEIYGNAISHYAHKADVLRLQILQMFGGIYFDIDVIPLKPFDSLLNNEFVMGEEGKDGKYGLCNAIILAKKSSSFLKRWYESYDSFDSGKWNYHSVILPKKLSERYPGDITVLDSDAFFAPLWDRRGLTDIYLRDFDISGKYAIHLWESIAKKTFLSRFSLYHLLTINNTFFSLMNAIYFGEKIGTAKIHEQKSLLAHWIVKDGQILNRFANSCHASINSLNGFMTRDNMFQKFDDHDILALFALGDHAFFPFCASLTTNFSISCTIRTFKEINYEDIIACLQDGEASIVLKLERNFGIFHSTFLLRLVAESQSCSIPFSLNSWTEIRIVRIFGSITLLADGNRCQVEVSLSAPQGFWLGGCPADFNSYDKSQFSGQLEFKRALLINLD